jgi:hypothetical protein
MATNAPQSFGWPERFATVASTRANPAEFSTAFRLTTSIALLATVASVGGLQLSNLYRDNAFVTAAWRGTDLVTLVVAVPLLAASAALARHGSVRGLLVWFGLIDYMLYNYAFYLFGAAFNEFFLLYTALFTLSIFTLVFGLAKVDATSLSRQFTANTPVKWISGYMLLVAVGLSAVYLVQIVPFITSEQLPAIVEATGHPTSVVFALDLSLVVPWLVLGSVWLARRRPWGYVIAAVVNVKAAVYTLALAAGSWWATRSGIPEAAAETPLWAALTVASSVAACGLLAHVEARPKGRP